LSAARTGYKRVSFAGWLGVFAARTGYEQVSFAGWLGVFAARTDYEQVSFAGWLGVFAARTDYEQVSFAGWLVGFAARTGYERVSFAGWRRQFQLRRCRRPTRGRQSPRPPDPGLRPASPPLRGPFASLGFLTGRRDAPSLARPRLFATSLSLVLKSLIRSALQTASQQPAVIFVFICGFFAAVMPEQSDCQCYCRQKKESVPPQPPGVFARRQTTLVP